MIFGVSVREFFVIGLASMVFIVLMKSLVAPHLPAGAQKLIGTV